MTDLHTHILPDMDDGSRNVTTTNMLIEDEIKNGVNQIAFTPHFVCSDESLSSFFARRKESFSQVDVSAFSDVSFKLGAEVYFCPELLSLDDSALLSLCLSDTHYMLLELSMSHKQEGVLEFVDRLVSLGITPIIAHIERYDYLKVSDISALVSKGCKVQCNCESVLRSKKETAFIKSLILKGLVHVFATDTHSVARRPVNLKLANDELAKLGVDVDVFASNADKIFWDKKIA